MRGVVALRVLKNLQVRTGKEPHELFDLICGTSTGGIIAILIGILKIPVDDCIALYESISKDVFEVGWLSQVASVVTDRSRYRASTLEQKMKEILEGKGLNPELSLKDCTGSPRVFVVAKRGTKPYLFRNYADTDDYGEHGTNEAMLWQAARATSAAPTYFPPIKIGRSTYVDGGIGVNNPAALACTEVKVILPWKGASIAALVSLGTGIPIYKGSNVSLTDIPRMLKEVATDCDLVHRNLQEEKYYFRFDVGEGIGDLSLDNVQCIDLMIEATGNMLGRKETRLLLEEVESLCTPVEMRFEGAIRGFSRSALPAPPVVCDFVGSDDMEVMETRDRGCKNGVL